MQFKAVMVEKTHGGALISGFHGLFSVGGFIGAGGMALLSRLGQPILGMAGVACCRLLAPACGFDFASAINSPGLYLTRRCSRPPRFRPTLWRAPARRL